MILFIAKFDLAAQENIFPIGSYLILSAKQLDDHGRNIVEKKNYPYIGEIITITKSRVTFLNYTRQIRILSYQRYNENEFLLEWGGSGYGPISFEDIGFTGSILLGFRVRYEYDPNWDYRKTFISTGYMLSDNEYLIIVNGYFCFCQKLT
jgi:hypothetical protein